MSVRRVLSALWKVPLCAIVYAVGRAGGGALAISFGMTPPPLPVEVDEKTLALCLPAAALAAAVGLAPLASGLRGRGLTRWLILAAFTYVCVAVNTAIEGAVFSELEGMSWLLAACLPGTMLCAGAAVLLFRPRESGGSFGADVRRFFGQRTAAQWRWRIPAAFLAFPVVYYFFGGIVGPFVIEHYQDQGLALRIPSHGVILATQMLRSLLYLAASLPVLIAWSGSRRGLVLSLGLAFFMLVGLMNLVQVPWLPVTMRVLHGAEIFADSMVYALVLTLLLAGKATAHNAAAPTGLAAGCAT